MSIVFRDFGTAYLAAPLAANGLSLTVDNATWLPTLSAGDYFYLVLQKYSDRSYVEIVKCTATAGNVLTIVRAQSGTAARSFAVGDYAELRLTSDGFSEFVSQGIATKMDKVGGDFSGLVRFLAASTPRYDLVRTSDSVAAGFVLDYSASEGHRTILGGATGSNALTPSILLRPNGYGSGTGQMKIDSAGNIDAWHLAVRSAQKTDPGAVVRYDTLAAYVPATRAINGHALATDFSITADETFAAGPVVNANAQFRATDFQYRQADGAYGVRLAVSAGIGYLQSGKTDSTLAEQKLYLSGWMGNPLALFKVLSDVELVHRKSGVDYKLFSEAYKPTAADVAALALAGGTMLGAIIAANIKSAIKVDNQRSVSYQDQANAMYHHMAVGNYFQINGGVNGTIPLWSLDSAGGVSQGGQLTFVDGNSKIVRSGSGQVRLAANAYSFVDGATGAYLSANCYYTGSVWSKWTPAAVGGMVGIDNGNFSYSVADAGSVALTLRFSVSQTGSVIANYLVGRNWASYGMAAYTVAELAGASGNLRGYLSAPFKITGVFALDAFLGTYAANATPDGLNHVLGFTDGAGYSKFWLLGAGGSMQYWSSTSSVGTIQSTSPMTAPSFTPTSDGRLKPVELREAIVDATVLLRKLNPQYYFKKYGIDIEKGFYEFGFIADEVQEHEPRLVFETNDEHKLKHLAVNGIVAHLSQGFKELDARLSRIEQHLFGV